MRVVVLWVLLTVVCAHNRFTLQRELDGLKKTPSPVPIEVKEEGGRVIINGGDIKVEVELSIFRLHVFDARTNTEEPWGKLGYGYWLGEDIPIYMGYLTRVGFLSEWHHAEKVVHWNKTDNMVTFEVQSSGLFFTHTTFVTFHEFFQRRFSFEAKVEGQDLSVNRIGMGFESSPNEGFFGFGERYNSVNQRGNQLSCWCEDGSWSLGEFGQRTSKIRVPGGLTATYIPMPWFISNQGYALQLDTPFRSTFDMCAEYSEGFWFDVETSHTGVTFYLGTPAELIDLFTEKEGGKSLIPPPWTFGPWNQAGGEFEGMNTSQAASHLIDLDIPSSHIVNTVHFLPKGSQRGQMEELKALNRNLQAMGFKSTAYFNAYVSVEYSPLFQEAQREGFFVGHVTNRSLPYEFEYIGASAFEVAETDFTNPSAVLWYKNLLWVGIEAGFSGWMYDYGEYTPPASLFFNGKEGVEMHNVYPLIYQHTCFDFFMNISKSTSKLYAPDYMHYVRSGYVGSQQWVWQQWTGDPSSDWSLASGLPAQIAASLSLGLSGLPFSGSDIGGFEWYVVPPPSPELWCRWTQVGAFSGNMHDQTGGTGFVPKTRWSDTEEGVTCWRKYAKLRTALFPYIFTEAHVSAGTGVPLMRHHLLDFWKDLEALKQDYQFSFGESFLVAPVIVPGDTSQRVYLPQGNGFDWIDVSSNLLWDTEDGRYRVGWSEFESGGKYVNVSAPLLTLPLFVRSGSIIPTLDPSVDTLNNASDPRVKTYFQLEKYIHLWVWPNAQLNAVGDTWDGATYSLKTSQSTAVFHIEDPLHRTTIIQITLKNPVKDVTTPTGQTIVQGSSWKALTQIGDLPSQWFFDSSQKVLWLRLEASLSAVQLHL